MSSAVRAERSREVASSQISGVRLLPDQTHSVPVHGPVEGTSRAELLLPAGSGGAPDRETLDRVGRAYWRFISRRSLGLIRAAIGPDGAIALLARGTRVALLHFGPPVQELTAAGGSITWAIAGGLLVSRRSPEGGFLRLTLERPPASESAGLPTLYATMEVRGFHPSLRGEGRLAPLGARVYAATQRPMHRAVTRGFLRTLAGLDPTG
ncbi:MAG: hypothetical protein WB771_04500 [Solirubrobacterales bacterium]